MMWLRETPAAVIEACMAMLPRLEAEESVLAQNVVAMGSGTLPPEKSAQIGQAWQDAMASQGAPAATAARRPGHVDVPGLRSLGVTVRTVKGVKMWIPPDERP